MKKLSLILLILSAHAVEASNASRFYVTGALGGTLLDVEVDQSFAFGNPQSTPHTISVPSDIDLSDGDVAGWLGVGYLYEFRNHLFLGAEVTAGFTNTTVDHKNGFVPVQGDFIFGEIKTKLENDFAALFKIGYISKQRTHLYVLVGPRLGNFESTLDTSIPPFLFTDEESGYELGITAGAGIEHKIMQRWSLGLEYAYTNYGEIDSPETFEQSMGSTISDDVDLEVSTNTIAAKLNYYF